MTRGEAGLRVAMWVVLVSVGAAAAILSFSALDDLAVLCGFRPQLAWLLPLVIDAGAAGGCLVWMGRHSGMGQSFARNLTWTLLASSVLGNAIVHGLSAYGRAAPWFLVVAVSAVAPAVLGAIVHLSVLVGRTPPEPEPEPELSLEERAVALIAQGAGRVQLQKLGLSEHAARQLLAASSQNGDAP